MITHAAPQKHYTVLLSRPVWVAFIFGGAEGQPVLTTKLSKDYIYSFRGDSSLLG